MLVSWKSPSFTALKYHNRENLAKNGPGTDRRGLRTARRMRCTIGTRIHKSKRGKVAPEIKAILGKFPVRCLMAAQDRYQGRDGRPGQKPLRNGPMKYCEPEDSTKSTTTARRICVDPPRNGSTPRCKRCASMQRGSSARGARLRGASFSGISTLSRATNGSSVISLQACEPSAGGTGLKPRPWALASGSNPISPYSRAPRGLPGFTRKSTLPCAGTLCAVQVLLLLSRAYVRPRSNTDPWRLGIQRERTILRLAQSYRTATSISYYTISGLLKLGTRERGTALTTIIRHGYTRTAHPNRGRPRFGFRSSICRLHRHLHHLSRFVSG